MLYYNSLFFHFPHPQAELPKGRIHSFNKFLLGISSVGRSLSSLNLCSILRFPSISIPGLRLGTLSVCGHGTLVAGSTGKWGMGSGSSLKCRGRNGPLSKLQAACYALWPAKESPGD